MGKLSSFCGDGGRRGWLALIIGLVVALLVSELAWAGSKYRGRDRSDRRGDFNDGASGRNNTRQSFDSWDRSGDGGFSARTSSTSPAGASSAASRRDADRHGNDRNDRASDKNDRDDKAAAANRDDDDDRGDRGAQRDGGRAESKANAGRGNADDAEPPRTVAEMLQRMFANAPGNEAKAPNPGEAARDQRGAARKAGEADQAPRASGLANAVQPDATPNRKDAAPQAVQAKRALQRATQPQLGWQRETRATDLFRRDEVLVVGASRATMAQLNFAHVETITTPGSSVSRFLVPEGLDAIAARQLLRQEMPALPSAFNYVYRPYVPSMDKSGFSSTLGQVIKPSAVKGCAADRCYGPSLIQWQPDPASCSIDIGIGVIDTGFDNQHPAFKDRRINWSTVLEGENVPVQAWHGTGVLALLSGHPHSSTPGLIPNATVTATNTFYADASGQPATDTTTLIKALRLMETYKVKVVNLSLAGPQDPVLHKQIKEMSEAGVLFVAAAGNGGPFALPSYPAAYPEVIAVTAVDRNLVGYRHATRGPHIDVAAPGVDVWTALPDRREGLQTGTSFAVPYVTAAAAAVYPKDELVYRGRPLDPKKAVLSRLTIRDLGPVGRDTIYGQGLLQAPPRCADKSGSGAVVEVSSAWSPTLQPVLQASEALPGSSLMSLTPSAEVRWPGVVQHLSFDQ
jgi:hypothetical protein